MPWACPWVSTKKLMKLRKEGFSLDQEELNNYLSSYMSGKDSSSTAKESEGGDDLVIKVPLARKKLGAPKTKGQIQYIDAMRGYDIVFSIGPAGTGKTYLAMAGKFLDEKKSPQDYINPSRD